MKVDHPRFGEVEVLQESPLFLQIEHPSHGYLMWFPRTELEVAVKQVAAKAPKVKKSPGEKAAAKATAQAKKNARNQEGVRRVQVLHARHPRHGPLRKVPPCF
jgi:hypothetical protein